MPEKAYQDEPRMGSFIDGTTAGEPIGEMFGEGELADVDDEGVH